MYEIANNRRATHPYRFLSAVSAGRFVSATSDTWSTMQVWDTHTWKCVQRLEPVRDEGDRDQWSKRGVKSVRSTLSCLVLSPEGFLACGSREGFVRLWARGGAERVASSSSGEPAEELVRRFGNLCADRGPVASVIVHGTTLLAAYRQVSGFTDGSAFKGEQSVAAWSLRDGALLWRVGGPSSPAATPTVGALACAGRLVLLHAESPDADADWNLVRQDSQTDADDHEGEWLLLRSAALCAGKKPASSGGDDEWMHLSRSGLGPGGGRLLAWDSDGGTLAFGFARGAVALLTLLPGAGSTPKTPESGRMPPVAIGSGSGADGADVACVKLLPPALLFESTAIGGDARGGAVLGSLAAADASGRVRIWALRRSSLEQSAEAPAKLSLECLHCFELGGAEQPCAIDLAGRALVCGCASGEMVALELPNLKHTLDAPATSGSAAVEGRATSRREYDWMVDTGAGPQARGLLRERRRYFDGWARTAAYEIGLQGVLAKMQSSQGTQHQGQVAGGGAAARGSTGSAGASAAGAERVGASVGGLKRGARVRISGLAARPELNGSLGIVLDAVEEESGRAPVKLVAPPEHAGKAMKVKPANLTLL